MSSLFSLLKDRINFWLWLPILWLFGILSGMIVFDIDQYLPKQINNILLVLPQPKTTIILLLLFLAISACYLLLFVSYTQKPKLKDYELIAPPGFYKHKKTGNYYCQKCLLKDKIAIPLSPISTEEYLCRVCKEPYKIDYQVLLCDSFMSIVYRESKIFGDHKKAVHEFYLNDNGKNC